MNISVIGLGKLGSSMVAVYASKGHRVIGVDLNQEYVEALNDHKAPVQEKNLAEYIAQNAARIEATTDYMYALQNSEITFIIVPSPTDETGGFSTKYIEEACKQIAKCLASKNAYHLIVVTSTVLPGDSEEKIIPTLEQCSSKKCGQDFGFCYSPEFIAIGSVIKDLLNPDFFLLGEYDVTSGDKLEDFYKTVSDNQAPVKRMSIASAELAKISVNSFLTMKITYGNMLAEIAEHIPGAHINDIADALGADKRIGKHYLKGGLGYGGPCFPRDNRAFNYVAQKYGAEAPYALATDTYNISIIQKTIKKIKQHVTPEMSLGIIGLSYKPGTHFAEESQAVAIAREMSQAGYKVHVVNPAGNAHAQTLLGDLVVYHDSIESCVEQVQALFLSNPDPATAHLPELVTKNSAIQVIIDPWRQFISKDFPVSIHYIPFGVNLSGTKKVN